MPLPVSAAPTPRLLIVLGTLAAGLLVVGSLDYWATRRDLLQTRVEQATSLRHAVAAAARSATASTRQAEAALTTRLLDNARLIDRLDATHALTQADLDTIASAHRLLRITIVDRSGRRQMMSGNGGPPAFAGLGRGPGGGRGTGNGRGPGSGQGAGQGTGPGGQVAERLLTGTDTEVATDIHGSRWGRGWRVSAGVRRSHGGAIILNADASAVAELYPQASLPALLTDVATGAPDIAYIILRDGEDSTAHGRLAEAAAATANGTGATLSFAPQERTIAGSSVLEFEGPLDEHTPGGASLRLGLSLDGLRAAERRALSRLGLSFAGALALATLAVAFVGLRREHGALRVEHALAQEALRRQDRLTAMGELAATVAHEIRNPLNAIAMSVQRLRREYVDSSPTMSDADTAERRELLEVLWGETQRINRIVQEFLAYARPPQLVPRETDIPALMAGVATSLAATAAAREVRLVTQADTVHHPAADPDLLTQALTNLAQNAIEAAPPGSDVSMRAARTDTNVVFEIEDHGAGMSPDTVHRIFDLYFSTKPHGTGVGLAITHRIIEAHHGTIEVDSTPGRGTRMIVRIPMLSEAQR